jgi:hypothetical protein
MCRESTLIRRANLCRLVRTPVPVYGRSHDTGLGNPALEFIYRRLKIEGIHAQQVGPALNTLLLSDADDVEVPAALLLGTLER